MKSCINTWCVEHPHHKDVIHFLNYNCWVWQYFINNIGTFFVQNEKGKNSKACVQVATGRRELNTLTPFCVEDRAYLVSRAAVVCFSPHRSLQVERDSRSGRGTMGKTAFLRAYRFYHGHLPMTPIMRQTAEKITRMYDSLISMYSLSELHSITLFKDCPASFYMLWTHSFLPCN